MGRILAQQEDDDDPDFETTGKKAVFELFVLFGVKTQDTPYISPLHDLFLNQAICRVLSAYTTGGTMMKW